MRYLKTKIKKLEQKLITNEPIVIFPKEGEDTEALLKETREDLERQGLENATIIIFPKGLMM